MPEAEVRFPRSLFNSESERGLFIEEIRVAVAGALSSRDYNGTMVELKPDEVDVILSPYENAAVRAGAIMMVALKGFDYPDRMQNIGDRLKSVAEALTHRVVVRMSVGDKQPVSVCFIAIQDGCWV